MRGTILGEDLLLSDFVFIGLVGQSCLERDITFGFLFIVIKNIRGSPAIYIGSGALSLL